MKDYVLEPEKRVSVAADVDVVVAGCGLSGVFAALSSARHGAKTLVVDRFAALGGHLGPGAILAAGLLEWGPERTFGAGFPALEQEVFDRVNASGGAARVFSRDPDRVGKEPIVVDTEGEHFPKQSAIFSHVVETMLGEMGTEFLHSTYAGSPIIEDGTVRGLFVESKSGRLAVRAKVVVDGTGDADLAFRAGAPTIRGVPPREEWSSIVTKERLNDHYRIWNECGLFFVVGGVDWDGWERFSSAPYEPTGQESAWEIDIVGRTDGRIPRKLIPELKAAYESGEYSPRIAVADRVYISGGLLKHGGHRFRPLGGGYVSSNMQAFGEVDTGDAFLASKLEKEIRGQIFKTVTFLRNHVPAFKNAYVFSIAPYMGSRGGRCIDGEYTLTVEDMLGSAKFPDVLYQNFHEVGRVKLAGLSSPSEPYDVPYRILQPQTIDGLLVTGTGAAFIRRGHDPSSMRAKCSMMLLGHAAGAAAALAAKMNTTPKRLKSGLLQQTLIEDGFFLGNPQRLADLGLG